MSRKLTKIEVIDRANEVHGYKYIYDKMDYVDSKTKVCIGCRIHGDFWQTPHDHLSGRGCPTCGKIIIKKKNKPFSQFEEEARKIHGEKYVYDESTYVNSKCKMKITCLVHGDFWQRPISHLRGCGCVKCANEKKSTNKRLSFEEFKNRAEQLHNRKYIYNDNNYVGYQTPIKITCPIHGDFWQKPEYHLQGCGCPECGGHKKMTKDIFCETANVVHNEKYIYDYIDYINQKTKVKIICPEHGEFWQTPECHLKGQGCPICGRKQAQNKNTKSFLMFVEEAKKIHNNIYVYNKKTYVNENTCTKITCPIHGDFWQKPKNHLKGQGCPECAKIRIGLKSRLSFEEFKNRAEQLHNRKYIYNDSSYVNYDTPIRITCPKHGDFWQTPDSHLQGHGCPKCSYSVSKAEDELNDYIKTECHTETVTRDRKLLSEKLECDILVPSHKLAIEFDGIIWHSEKFGKDKGYHLHKTELAESKGYHLIHIFEDEWLEHKELVLRKIRHILGCDLDKPVIGARKCVIKTLSKPLVEEFLTTYHLQGFVGSTAYYGAYYGDILVGAMTFKQEKPDMWNLTRFATNTDYRLPGLASKMFKQFIKDNNPIEVKTFLDRRWSYTSNNLYDKLGFKLAETLSPDYRYVVKNKRLHKFGFRKQILSKNYNLPLSMTEKEMTEKLGYYRIWDCGLYKYVWKYPS